MHLHTTGRVIPERVELLDRANTRVRWLTREEVAGLLRSGEVEPLGTKARIHAVRWCSSAPPGVDATPGRRFEIRRRGLGSPHRRETDHNPRGVWTFDRIARRDRRQFFAVVEDVAA